MAPRLLTRFVPLLTPALMFGCVGSSDSTESQGEFAGAQIVENETPRWSEAEVWRVSDVPVLTIGSSTGADAYMLFQVPGAVRLSDKSIVIANGGTNEIRWFDSTGAFVRSVGRHGEGPGEFNRIAALLRGLADTVFVWDQRLQRVSVFSPSGTHVRTVRRTSTEYPWATPLGLFGDGTFVLDGRPTPPRAARLGRMGWDTTAYLWTRSIGDTETVIVRRPYRSYYGHEWERTVAPNTVVFAPIPSTAVASEMLYYTKGEHFEIEAYEPNGTLVRLIRRNVVPTRIRDGDVERYAEWRVENATSNIDEEGWRRVFDQSPREEFFPFIRELLVDADENLWVKHYRPDWEEELPSLWSVFDAAGRWLGEVEIPDGVTVFQIGADFVLGLTKNDLDVETVVMFPLTRPG
jgi:hypothetical protein